MKMAYKPILFNTEMVKAILEGRKTQTRRIIKPQPTKPRWNNIGWLGFDDGHGYRMKHPCNPGDILWVRETWYKDACRYMYRANYTDNEQFFRNGKEVQIRWKPSIHMPREAARIFLRVKDVRVERLQDARDSQCMAEGVTCPWNVDLRDAFSVLWDSTINPADRDIYGWNANPWVWVIEFERVNEK